MIPLKDDSPSALKPVVTLSLIVGCALVFLWQRSLDAASSRQAVAALGAIPAVLLTDARLPPDWQWITRFATPLTSMFLHVGWLHLLGNMLFLLIFGNNVEDRFRKIPYLIFYVACGYVAAYGFAFVHPGSVEPLVGASGAIAGVLGAYLALYPRARVWSLVPFLFFIPLRIPAWIVLGLWFLLQWAYSLGFAAGGGGVAYVAHVFGFLAGLLVGLVVRASSSQRAVST